MTATAPAPDARTTTARGVGPSAALGPRRVAAHVATIAWRNLLQIPRTPQLLVFIAVQPIMFTLLFAYVFGGAIDTGGAGGAGGAGGGAAGVDYVDFLIPGVIVQTVAFGTAATSVGLAEDRAKGLIDRLRSLPIARSAVLAGRVLADTARIALTVMIIVVVGLLIGFEFRAGALPAVGMVALATAFGSALSWVAAAIGMRVSTPEVAQSAGVFWLFPLTFASSAFVPVDTMPGWLRVFAEVNPITVVVDALRALALGGPTAGHVWASLAWIAGIAVVFAPLAVRAYRRTA